MEEEGSQYEGAGQELYTGASPVSLEIADFYGLDR